MSTLKMAPSIGQTNRNFIALIRVIINMVHFIITIEEQRVQNLLKYHNFYLTLENVIDKLEKLVYVHIISMQNTFW